MPTIKEPTKLTLARLDPDALSRNPRATQAAWIKYQGIVVTAFNQHPQTYIYKPTDMSSTTVASRLRDAIRGVLAFRYPSLILHVDLLQWYSEVIIRHDYEHVYIGPRGSKETEPLAPETTKDTFTFDSLSMEEVTAFCILLNNGRIQGPVIIKDAVNLSPFIPTFPNIEVLQRPNGSVVLL